MRQTCLVIFFTFFVHFLLAGGQLQIITSGGFQGVADAEGQVVIPAIYEKLGWSDGSNTITDESIGYFENGRWGLINIRTKKLTGATYASLKPFDKDLFEAGIAGKFSNLIFRGIIDNKSKTHVDFKYYTIENIGDQLLIVSEYNSGGLKYGLLNLENQEVLPLEFSNVKRVGKLIIAQNKIRKNRVYDLSGQVLIYPWIDHVEQVESGFVVSNEGYFGLLNEDGYVVHGMEFKSIAGGKPEAFPSWEIREINEKNSSHFSCDSITYNETTGLLIAHVNHVEHLLAASETLFKDKQHSLKHIGNGFLVAKNRVSQLWGIYKTDGREVAEGFDSVAVDSSYFYVQQGKRWSIYNMFGRALSDESYQAVGASHAGFIPVKKNDFWGWLDFQGQQVVEFKYEAVMSTNQSQTYLARNFGKWGIRSFYEDWLVMPKYDSIVVANQFYLAKKGLSTHVYNKDMKLLYRLPYQVNVDEMMVVNNRDSLGVVTWNGYLVAPKYDEVSLHSGYYELQQGEIVSLIEGNGRVAFDLDEQIQDVLSFSEGYFHIIKDGKHGFVDTNGKLRIANRYDSAQFFNEGMAPVKLLGKWGFIGPYENLLIQPFYKSSSVFVNDRAIIQVDDQYGLIDKKGKEIILPTWKYVERLTTGNYRITDWQDQVGLADQTGRILIRPNFQSITDSDQSLIIADRNGKIGVMDYTGLTKVPFEYAEIKIVGDYLLLRKE